MYELLEQRFLIDLVLKSHILALVRACAQECANAQARKAGLAKQAALIASLAVFRRLCLGDLTGVPPYMESIL